MINNIAFQAEPKDPIKIGLDLQIPVTMNFKFTLSGECDKEFLKKLTRLIKLNSKTKNE